jgi:hypothetical protein
MLIIFYGENFSLGVSPGNYSLNSLDNETLLSYSFATASFFKLLQNIAATLRVTGFLPRWLLLTLLESSTTCYNNR